MPPNPYNITSCLQCSLSPSYHLTHHFTLGKHCTCITITILMKSDVMGQAACLGLGSQSAAENPGALHSSNESLQVMDNDVILKRFPFLPRILMGLINRNVYMLFRNKNKHLSETLERDMHYPTFTLIPIIRIYCLLTSVLEQASSGITKLF